MRQLDLLDEVLVAGGARVTDESIREAAAKLAKARQRADKARRKVAECEAVLQDLLGDREEFFQIGVRMHFKRPPVQAMVDIDRLKDEFPDLDISPFLSPQDMTTGALLVSVDPKVTEHAPRPADEPGRPGMSPDRSRH